MDERVLIRQLKDKDFQGLESLIEFYGASILRTVHSILNQGAEKNHWPDLENEIFYEIWQKIHQFDEKKSSFATWVLMIARSRCIDKKRQLKKEQTQQPLEMINQTLTEDPLAKEDFLYLIDVLNETDQRIFVLHYFYQLSPQEIASSVGLETSAIYNHLSRGRTKLKKVLQERMMGHEI